MDSPKKPPKSPTHPSLGVRYGTMKPFGDDAPLSTRGQKLPHIIQNRSATSLAATVSNQEHRIAHPTPKRSARSYVFPPHHDPEEVDAELGLHRARTSDERRRWEHRHSTSADIEVSGDGRGIMIESDHYDYRETPSPPPNFPLTMNLVEDFRRERRASLAASLLNTPQMRSQRLIGNSNPRYQWEQYYKTEDELKAYDKPLRMYYERNNYLIQQYLYIDKLLDSSLPHDLIQEYHHPEVDVPDTIHEEEPSTQTSPSISPADGSGADEGKPPAQDTSRKVKRTPKDIYRVAQDENTPLLQRDGVDDEEMTGPVVPMFEPEEEMDSSDRIVAVAIYINLAANTVLLAMKIVVTVLTSSVSVLASLVDAALDFLSTAIVFVTTRLINHGSHDTMAFPVGRQRLEPIGVLVFSVVMITSFFQVAIEAINRLLGTERIIVALSPAAIAIMVATIIIKGLCWLWCRLIKNSSVQALAQDAETDVVFNFFSIIFPLVGFYTKQWWMDPLGGLLLSGYVIVNWGRTTRTHILNLTGHAASKDERNILLYLTMRFAHTIKYIQGLAAYHAGDKLNVEVDIVLDEQMNLRDSHDLGESLQYVIESVPGVERAFVHADYQTINLPTHMRQS